MSSTSFSVISPPRPRRTRHLPSTMTAMNAITYMRPYQRTESGPRLKTMGSNCGWVSTERHSFSETGADAPHYPRARQAARTPSRAHQWKRDLRPGRNSRSGGAKIADVYLRRSTGLSDEVAHVAARRARGRDP